MRRKGYQFNTLQIVLCLVIIVLTVVLFFKAGEASVWFPVVFGLSAVLSAIYALEGIVFNKQRIVDKKRVIIFSIVTVLLLIVTVFSILVLYL